MKINIEKLNELPELKEGSVLTFMEDDSYSGNRLMVIRDKDEKYTLLDLEEGVLWNSDWCDNLDKLKTKIKSTSDYAILNLKEINIICY